MYNSNNPLPSLKNGCQEIITLKYEVSSYKVVS